MDRPRASPRPHDDIEITGEVTKLLGRWKQGDEEAFEDLLPLVYSDLRAIAARYMSRERRDHSLQATELVHEAYMRLSKAARLDARDRCHFFSVAARAMRRILVDHARQRLTEKRRTARHRTPLEDPAVQSLETPEDILGVHDALNELVEREPRSAQLIELRFFGGLSESEAADVLGISRATATRDWRFARLWLLDYLGDGDAKNRAQAH